MSVDWKALDASAWHHPGLAWVCTALAVAVTLKRVPAGATRTVLLALCGETALDALFTGGLSPLAPASPAAQSVAIAFVIAGDLRLFWLLERFRGGASWAQALGRAVAWSFLVPVAQAAAIRSFPAVFAERRAIYLVYELLFAALAAGLLVARYPSRAATSPSRGWYATFLLLFFLAQYGLWVACDVLILRGHDWALGLRLAPNAMYYGLFLALAAWRAPAEEVRA